MPLQAHTVARIRDGILTGGFPATLSLTLDLAEPDHCRIRMPESAACLNAVGIVHGGATAALLDTAATAAAWACDDLGATARGTTVGFSVNFLNFARGADIVADAKVIRRGGSLVVVDVEIADDHGHPVAKGTVTYKLSPHSGPTSISQP